MNPSDKPIPRLTKELLSRPRVIARGRGIRDVARLIATYGGIASGWIKKSTQRLRDEHGMFEVHWYADLS